MYKSTRQCKLEAMLHLNAATESSFTLEQIHNALCGATHTKRAQDAKRNLDMAAIVGEAMGECDDDFEAELTANLHAAFAEELLRILGVDEGHTRRQEGLAAVRPEWMDGVSRAK